MKTIEVEMEVKGSGRLEPLYAVVGLIKSLSKECGDYYKKQGMEVEAQFFENFITRLERDFEQFQEGLELHYALLEDAKLGHLMADSDGEHENL